MKVRILKKMLKKLGFYQIRAGKGSHETWGDDSGKIFTIPGAPGKELKEGTFHSILKSADISLKSLEEKN